MTNCERMLRMFLLSAGDTSQGVIDTLRLLNGYRHIYLMPLGGGGGCLDRLKRAGVQVTAFCDNDPAKAGTVYDGIPVVAYRDLLADPHRLVLVTSGTYFHELRAQLEADAVDYIDAMAFVDILGEDVATARAYLAGHVPALLETLALFEEERSREIYAAALMARLTRGAAAMARYRERAEEYIPSGHTDPGGGGVNL